MLHANRTIWLTIIAAIAILSAAIAGWVYKVYCKDAIASDPVEVYITPQMPADSLRNMLSQTTGDITADRIISLMNRMGFRPEQQNTRCGFFRLPASTSIYKAARRLIAGSQTPIRFTFNNIRTIDEFIDKVDRAFYMSSDSLSALISNTETCTAFGFDTATIAAMFIPDTYEFYWTVKPEAFLKRMNSYYNRFWTDERKALARKAGLSPVEVSILASIVEEETAKKDEMPTVAGLYLNRLQRNMPLQADPTVKFAVGDFSLRRITANHLAVESPYNTYRHTGLPPGPIRIPSQTAIDAVLHYKQHNYLYMCAKEDFSGYHNFAATLSEHNRNAARYHAALNRLKIH